MNAKSFSVRYRDRTAKNTIFVAATPEVAIVMNLHITSGRWINEADSNHNSNVVVLGHDTAETIFPANVDPVDKTVEIEGQPFRVIGVLEKRKDKYQITAQGALDTEGFSHANWSTELVDADEDGYAEVIFSGRDSEENPIQRRLMLFVPNDNRTYSMLMNGDTTPRGTPRITWLSNAAGTNAAAYRTALRQRARAIVAKR